MLELSYLNKNDRFMGDYFRHPVTSHKILCNFPFMNISLTNIIINFLNNYEFIGTKRKSFDELLNIMMSYIINIYFLWKNIDRLVTVETRRGLLDSLTRKISSAVITSTMRNFPSVVIKIDYRIKGKVPLYKNLDINTPINLESLLIDYILY